MCERESVCGGGGWEGRITTSVVAVWGGESCIRGALRHFLADTLVSLCIYMCMCVCIVCMCCVLCVVLRLMISVYP